MDKHGLEMSNSGDGDFEKTLHQLFSFAFISNCELMDEKLPPEELETLQDLDTAEVLENFKDLVVELLDYKRSNLKSDKSDLIQQNEQFEEMLQKLEGEVRNHIRIEQQLKLHLESSQAKLDETEKKYAVLQKKFDAVEAQLSNAGEPLESPALLLEKQLKALEHRYKQEISRLTHEQTSALKNSSRHARVSSEAYSSAVIAQQSRQSPSPVKKTKRVEQMDQMMRSRQKDPLSERIKDEVLKEELEIVRRLNAKEPPRPESRLSNKPVSAHKKSRSESQSSNRVPDRRPRSQKGTLLV